MANKQMLSLPDTALADIRSFLANLDEIAKLVEQAKSLKPDASPEPLFRVLSSNSPLNLGDVQRGFNTLENLGYLEERGFDFDAVFSQIEGHLALADATLWRQRRDDIFRALEQYKDNHPIRISSKAQKLALLHEKIYLDGEIITDVRPAFDAAGRQVFEFLVSHMLILNYRSANSRERMHFALDSTDVADLRNACDRALVKAQAIKTALGEGSWSVRIVNDDDEAV